MSGKVIIVTGGTLGIGRAIASGLAEADARVVVASRHQDACDEVAAHIAKETGAEVIGIACDVGEWNAVPAFVDTIYDHFGRVDAVFNNAAISSFQTVLEMTSEEWDEMMAVNLKGPLRLSALVAPLMAEGGGGSIINVSSIAAYQPRLRNSHYAASKAALNNLTRSMAAEWAPLGIRVNTIVPGPTLTGMTTSEPTTPGSMEPAPRSTLMQRRASPEEFIGIAMYLASDASSFVTGAEYVVGGHPR